MLINAVGRDLLLLISMVVVMVSQDPLMSFLGLVAVPPAMLVLRKLVKRIKGLAYTSSPAPPTFWRPCRNRCRASAP